MSDDDTYTRHHCPQCGVLNVVACGDPSDCTSTLGEGPACKCWYCDHKFWRFDMTDPGVIEGYYDWDAEKSLDENLKEAPAEDGEPDEDGNAYYERFLDSPCSECKNSTWRGYLIYLLDAQVEFNMRLKGVDVDRLVPPFGIMSVNRIERIKAINQALSINALKPEMAIANAFCKAEGMRLDPATFSGNHARMQQAAKLKDLLCYIMCIEHAELDLQIQKEKKK